MRLVLALAMLCPATLHAACYGAGEPLFHCTAQGGAREISVCLQDDVAIYGFGAPNSVPELLLARSVRALDMTPWPGIGRTIWEDMTFHNGEFSYLVSWAVDRLDETGEADEPTGILIVSRGLDTISELTCDAGSVSVSDFYPVYLAKEAAAQCYDRGEARWTDC